MPRFFYFDMGNVLLHFDHRIAARQMAELAGAEADALWEFFVESGLVWRCDAGEVDAEAFYAEFCRCTGASCSREALWQAASNIFHMNASIIPVITALAQAGHRLGIISNTCDMHWRFITEGYCPWLADLFDPVILSYEHKLVKPDTAIFQLAAQRVGVRPQEIFYTDDIAGHVAGAKAAGFDAVQYVGTPQLVRALRQRGVEMAY